MAYEERALDGTAVGVCVTSAQNFQVAIIVVVIHGSVECQQNHLWNLKQKREIMKRTQS